jgi:hypothetical protein
MRLKESLKNRSDSSDRGTMLLATLFGFIDVLFLVVIATIVILVDHLGTPRIFVIIGGVAVFFCLRIYWFHRAQAATSMQDEGSDKSK